ncbi:putative cardiolipin synthase [Sphingobium sp. SYK-6]|uniref:phospholipase D-like domain-containing protein n=1 Tax=Sphingobium sp. (strain NBRC 103272 / SYK-6) TaxID=627192 RepID=UPI00022772E5|nr:phosphatidylserine/phosphatidylglycerophosphate/cardiolipin synthase family protein [Sphingobium sp. SYK-6]BAK67026.1 putative cardiolipin synthase [Sphingobium sp. SYK-6]
MESHGARQAREEAVARHIVAGNELLLIPGGIERLEALLGLIADARERLDIFYYIFGRDECSQQVIDALVEACNRHVAVTLIVDAFGTATTPDSVFAPLREAGARFARFGAHRTTRYLIRNHQKMAIADGRHALIGGFNCEKSYFGSWTEELAWCDLGMMVRGPLAGALQHWFDALADWTIDSPQRFRRLRQLVRDWKPGTGEARWLIGGPTRYLNSWTRHVKADLEKGERLDLVAAYFSPSRGMIKRINGVARRGCARLIAPMRSDNSATIGAARHLYKRLLRGGVRIFEYRPQKLHMKLIVIDDIVYVGSANFDMRSLFINLELMLRIEDAAFAAEARALVERLAADSDEIDARVHRYMAGPLQRFIWSLQYLLVGVLDYTVTRRLNSRRKR